jgi:hypothetical protein
MREAAPKKRKSEREGKKAQLKDPAVPTQSS